MTEVNPPNQYFPTIIYNPQFWTSSSSSGQYLGRVGSPTSIATNTTFTGTIIASGITTNDLTVANLINGTILRANNVNSYNNNANLTHYLTYVDTSTDGYGILQKHATLTYNPYQELLIVRRFLATISLTANGGITASVAQTINFGTNAPTMSGANIMSGTVGQTQVSNGYVDLSSAQTVAGIKTFSDPPVMSGASITASTVGQTQVSNGYVDLSSAQSSIAGNKTFTDSTQINTLQYNTIFSPYSVGAITTTSTLPTPLNNNYTWNATASQTITMPVITTPMIGISITFRRITTSNTNVLSIIAGAGNSVLSRNDITEVANPTSTPLLTSNATPLLAFSSSITCINSTTWAIMA